jgi:alkanesulfonate monooxygenase SsuD/methylene tetrahydromethanopterin reductase-like flavin-dependent oxidoreductase (luciferase family)
MNGLTFGVNVSTSATPGADPVHFAQLAESMGFDFVSASDHPCGLSPSYETWTMLTWIAAATTRIKVATRVLGVPYRSPAMVAKMAETLDRFSEGRLILGLGGGYSDDEFRAFGLSEPSRKDKIDGLGEAVQVIRGLWSQPSFTFSGRLHRTDRADLEPKPDHGIPIWLGTFGDRALAVTGRYADGWIPSLGYAPANQLSGMRDKVLLAAQAAGRSPTDVECALNLQIHVSRNSEVSTDVISGPAGYLVERLSQFVEIGFTSFNLMPQGEFPSTQMEQIATEVIPRLRASPDR